MDKLLKFLNGLNKDAREAFAIACGTSVGYLRKAVSSGQLLNATTCVRIEQESCGQIIREELHPDDWQDIWPELATDTTRRATDPAPTTTGEPHEHS